MAFISKTLDRNVVPWFSMREWEEVYQQVYSGEALYVKKGYEKMLVWKTRCPTLPAGVESTLSLIQAWLQDQEVMLQITSGLLPPYREHDLQVMFSTAIMRFLNQMATIAQDGTETMYTMAKKLHIPDWVVTIRHDVAHGLNLPPITVLREAMQFSLIWIHEHYWKGETNSTQNLVVTTGSAEQTKEGLTYELQEYIELWQALKLYQQSDYVDVDSIPDHDLKLRLKKVIESNLQKGYKILKTPSVSKGGNEPNSKILINSWTTVELLEQILNHLQTFLIANKNRIDKEQVVDGILEGETFIPNETVLRSLCMDNDDRKNYHPIRLLQLWEDVLLALHPTDILSILLQKLIDLTGKNEESNYKQRLAAIWVKELCLGITKAQMIHQFMEEHDEMFYEKKPHQEVISKFERVHPELRNVITLKLTHLPNLSKDSVEQTVLMPNKWMYIYLPRLLDLVEPALSKAAKNHLFQLVKIYTSEEKQSSDFDKQNQVYTVEMLIEECDVEVSNDMAAIDADPENNQKIQEVSITEEHRGDWVPCQDNLLWENCPLGMLPWQRKMMSLDFSLPSDLVWTSSHPVQPLDTFNQELPLSSNKTINWEEIKLSKRVKKHKKSISTLVKKALETVGYYDRNKM